MINFRYHVVSLTAVFLALAIGLVVGTAALNGPAADALKSQVNSLTKTNQRYRDQITQLENGADKQDQFANESAPMLLHARLAGRRVVVVTMPQASDYADDVVGMLKLAGATVTGTIEIEDTFADPANNDKLLDLASTVPAGLTGVPANSDGVETASFLLASVLLEHTPPLKAAAQSTVLSAFKDANLVAADGDVSGTAEAIVLLATQPYTDSDAVKKNANVKTMVGQFAAVGPEVVAASGAAGAGNAISAVRGDPTLSKSVSTVDNVATPPGQVAVALALDEQLTAHKAGQYGLADGASSMLPKLVPS